MKVTLKSDGSVMVDMGDGQVLVPDSVINEDEPEGSVTNRYGTDWEEREAIPVIYIYRAAGRQLSQEHPRVLLVAESLQRSPGSISKRVANFAAIDPNNPNRGLDAGLAEGGYVERTWTAFGSLPMDVLYAAAKVIVPDLPGSD